MSQRGLHLLRAARQEAEEDHLGAGLIRHGDSVIIMNEAGKGDSFSRRVEPRDIVPLLPLVAEGLFIFERSVCYEDYVTRWFREGIRICNVHY